MKNEEKLKAAIIASSESTEWMYARQEWKLDMILYDSTGESRCACSHKIHELCYLMNTINGNRLLVGNCCVKKFLPDLSSDKIFKCLGKIYKDILYPANRLVIDYMYKHEVINEWEYKYCNDTRRKKTDDLSDKQRNRRKIINQKMLTALRTNDNMSMDAFTELI